MAVGESENTYDVDDLVRLTADFTVGGAGTDPGATPTLIVLAPDGTRTTPTPTSDGAGAYHYDLSITQSGRWRYRYSGISPAQAAEERSFLVREQQVV